MPIEAELKARVDDAEAVRARLGALAAAEHAIYRDAYFDKPDEGFMAGGHELRLRTVSTSSSVRTVLTFKAPAVDEASGSKPEFETGVADLAATAAILEGLGYRKVLAFSKRCENHEFTTGGYPMLATLVTVPEIDGTFLEVETLVDAAGDLDAALGAIKAVLLDLGIGPDALTADLYTDAVARARG